MERPPQRSRKGVQIHAHFVLLAFALCQGYRLWEAAQIAAEEAGQSSTLGEYIRLLQRHYLEAVCNAPDYEVGKRLAAEVTTRFEAAYPSAIRRTLAASQVHRARAQAATALPRGA